MIVNLRRVTTLLFGYFVVKRTYITAFLKLVPCIFYTQMITRLLDIKTYRALWLMIKVLTMTFY
ncbi:hypothetical protein [Tetragenococcus koreensis]|uniref:hypothetical protein n=1 Tax=Tetragenococcus koreensis TaxID=290335 RepID=UPI001F25120B|nr:hypothetical protein [Tetragenococcus koreensis]MCF1621057.1 hypothetical protein [Tetragenococcus koreensis]MCF1631441.1 hypothetical protein [Tetragenococcus koreensis]MCF1686356.1 hypothetical protein [Tetragenococcus koreensis]MDN5810929.1 hypothetical protein [Tetragenococcus koreensis]MDN6251277.1 hypothetical protein [Tetragenococcus koreensis]